MLLGEYSWQKLGNQKPAAGFGWQRVRAFAWFRSGDLIYHQTIADPAHVDQINGLVHVRLNCQTDMVNVPLDKFLRLTRVRLVSLCFRNQGLVIDDIGSAARQNE